MNTSLPKSPCRAYSQHSVMVVACDFCNLGKLRPEDKDFVTESGGFLVQGPAMAEDTICGAACPEDMATRIVKVLDIETQKLAVFTEDARWDAPFKEIYTGYRGTERHPENEEPKTMDAIFTPHDMPGNERYAYRFPQHTRIIFRQPTSVELRAFEASPLLAGANDAMLKAAGANALLSIRQAGEYARVSERTIRAWLMRMDANGTLMLPGVVKVGRMIRIPRTDLDKWRKPTKDTRKPKKASRKRTARNAVK